MHTRPTCPDPEPRPGSGVISEVLGYPGPRVPVGHAGSRGNPTFARLTQRPMDRNNDGLPFRPYLPFHNFSPQPAVRDALYGGRIVQGMHRSRDESP
jgi:hypothetical protein